VAAKHKGIRSFPEWLLSRMFSWIRRFPEQLFVSDNV